jgi:Holliday junction resolvasome RuvABC DNA-binding subunit
MDELSQAIRALVGLGFSRNKVTQMLVIPGGRADQLRRIREALGEVEL